MAADAGSILIKILGDDSDFSSAMSSVSSVASASMKIATAAIAATATALVAAGTAAYNYGTEFETSLTKVETIADTSAVSIDELGDSVLSLSNSLGIAATELNEATYQAISAGVDTAEAVEFVGQAATLAEAGFTDVTTSVDILTTAMNAYGDSAKTAEEISDILLTTQNLGKTTVDELGSSLGTVIPTAAAYGVEIDQLGAAYATLTANGIATAESGTYLKSMLSELGKSGTTASTALEASTGATFAELTEQGYSLGDILAVLQDEADATGVSIFDMFSSTEAATAASSLLNAGAEGFNETLEAMQDSAGATEEAFEIVDNTIERSVEKITTNLQNLAISVYNSADGPLSDAVGMLADISESFNTAFDEDGFEGLVNAAGNAVGILITEITEALPQLTEAAVGIVTSLAEQLVENAPQIALAAGELLTALSTGIFTLLPLMAELALTLIISFGQYLAENAESLASGAVGVIVTLAQLLTDNLPTIIDTALLIITSISTALLDNVGLLTEAASQLMLALIIALFLALPDIIFSVNDIFTAISEAIMAQYDYFVACGDSLIYGLWDGAKAVFANVLTWAGTQILALVNVFNSLYSKFKEVGTNIVDGIWEGISSGWDWLTEQVASLAAKLLEAAKAALGIHSPSTAFRDDFSGNIIDGGVVGIVENKDKLIGAVTDMGEDILSDIDALGIADAAMGIFGGADGTVAQLNWGVGVPSDGGTSNSAVYYTTTNNFDTTIEGVDSDPDVIAQKIKDIWEYGQ